MAERKTRAKYPLVESYQKQKLCNSPQHNQFFYNISKVKLLMFIQPNWIREYQIKHLSADLLAGILVTILVLPQSLAYAILAGLPPQLGLYASIFPVFVYAIFGSSNIQAVGPVAITAIMTFSVLSPLATPGSVHYVMMAATLSLMSGLLVLAFGIFRLGFLSNLLSRPVVGGFISGSALLILLNQIKFILDVRVSDNSNWGHLVSIVQQLKITNPNTLLLGGSGFLILFIARNFLTKWLETIGVSNFWASLITRITPLLVVVISTALTIQLNLDNHFDIKVVGNIPSELPQFSFNLPASSDLFLLFGPALVLAFIGAVQNITMAHALAIKRHERTDSNKELIGLGSSNIMTAFCGGMPVGGGLTRSAVNLASGAQTPLASIVSAMSMLCILLIGVDWFSKIPLCILAASIMVAAISMIDLSGFWRAWNYDRADGLSFLATGLGVLIINLQFGIILGILLSVASLLYRVSSPHIVVVGRIKGTEHFRNIERHQVETLPNSLFLRIDESLFYGNLSPIESRLMMEISKIPNISSVVLIMSAVNRIDVTALEVITEVLLTLKTRKINLHFAELKGPVQDRLLNTSLLNNLTGCIHLSSNDAFEFLNSETKTKSLY